jgi:hypothetical protein
MIQGFSGGLLNRELIYQTDLPSFQRDFASLKTLDHGTGPAITFTRASNATYFDADGVLQTASNNVPRFDHSATGSSLGLLIEEARTNSIRNSQAGGSTNGVIGSGGVMPTHWETSAFDATGVVTEIVGTGTEDGFAYIDFKFTGTPTASGGRFINPELSTQVAATNAQTWTNSAYVQLVSGSMSSVATAIQIYGRTSVSANIAGQDASVSFTPTSAALSTQRQTASRTFSDATVAEILGTIFVSWNSGQEIGGSADGITLRIAAPQLEQGAFATSYIPTTSAAATRAADSAVVTPISSFYNQSEGTLFAEANPRSLTTQGGVNRQFLNFNSGDGAHQNYLGQESTTDSLVYVYYLLAGGNPTAMLVGSSILSGAQKIIGAYKVDNFAGVANGGTPNTQSSGSLSSAFTHLSIGFGADANTGILSGHIRKIAYWPRRLSNTLLQQLTT